MHIIYMSDIAILYICHIYLKHERVGQMVFLFDQIRTFFYMLIFGFFSALIFNLYQFIIHRYKLRRFIIHISDTFFSIILGILGFLLLIYINNGNLRFYVILAIIIGFVICYSLVNYLKKT